MCIGGLHNSNGHRLIDHPKYTILEKDAVVLDVTFQSYSQESLFEDVICKNCLSGSSEPIK